MPQQLIICFIFLVLRISNFIHAFRSPPPTHPFCCSIRKAMDFVKYVNKYSGQTRLQRINFLAKTFPEFRPEGVKMLLDELKRTKNWFMYANCCENFGVPVDKQWYETHKQQTKLHITQMEAKINTTRRARGNIQVAMFSCAFLYHSKCFNLIACFSLSLFPWQTGPGVRKSAIISQCWSSSTCYQHVPAGT